MSPSDIIDSKFAFGVENRHSFGVIEEKPIDIMNWDLQVELVMLDILGFPDIAKGHVNDCWHYVLSD